MLLQTGQKHPCWHLFTKLPKQSLQECAGLSSLLFWEQNLSYMAWFSLLLFWSKTKVLWPGFLSARAWLLGLSVTLTDNQLRSKLHHQQLSPFSANPDLISPAPIFSILLIKSNHNSKPAEQTHKISDFCKVVLSLAQLTHIFMDLYLFLSIVLEDKCERKRRNWIFTHNSWERAHLWWWKVYQ